MATNSDSPFNWRNEKSKIDLRQENTLNKSVIKMIRKDAYGQQRSFTKAGMQLSDQRHVPPKEFHVYSKAKPSKGLP